MLELVLVPGLPERATAGRHTQRAHARSRKVAFAVVAVDRTVAVPPQAVIGHPRSIGSV